MIPILDKVANCTCNIVFGLFDHWAEGVFVSLLSGVAAFDLYSEILQERKIAWVRYCEGKNCTICNYEYSGNVGNFDNIVCNDRG